MSYKIYSKFFDLIEGEQKEQVKHLSSIIHDYYPSAQTLLELGCGTGTLLKGLKKSYDVAGLDCSPEMLDIARKKLPNVPFYEQSMAGFSIKKKFDCVVCVFDSINHVLSFEEWHDTFKATAHHLNKNGIFIIDINPPARLWGLSQGKEHVRTFGDNYAIMRISHVDDENADLFKLDIKIFEKQNGSSYKLHRVTIHEVTFPMLQVKHELEKYFTILDEFNSSREPISLDHERVWFVCQKK